MLVESISFGGVGRDSGACNSCLGAESVLAGGWRLSLLTAVAVCSHHREALASPDVPGITHILNRGGEGGERLLIPIFSVLGAHYWGIVRGGFEVYPPPQRAILNGHSRNTSSEPPLYPKLPWPLHDGSATLEFCVSGQSPAREDQRCAHREDMRLSHCALRLLYPQRGHCSLRSCRGLYRADRQKTHPAFWFVSESWRINNSLRCQSLSAKIWILKWNLRATTATVVG